jgi:hypothetical protein
MTLGGTVMPKLILRYWALSVAALGAAVDPLSAISRLNASRWRVLTLCAAIVAAGIVTACGGSTEPGPPNIAGNWQLSFGVTSAVSTAVLVTCSSTGALSISQSSRNFTGQLSGTNVVCLSTQGDSTNIGSVDGPLANGVIQHIAMSFSVGGCSFTDGLIVVANNDVTGGAHCSFSYQGHSYLFTGTFGLER